MKSEKDFLVCPACGSTRMKWLLGGRLGDRYKCSGCGYEGIALRGNSRFIKKLQAGKK